MHIFKSFPEHICQLFAELRGTAGICHLSLQEMQAPALPRCSCHGVTSKQVAAGTARVTLARVRCCHYEGGPVAPFSIFCPMGNVQKNGI